MRGLEPQKKNLVGQINGRTSRLLDQGRGRVGENYNCSSYSNGMWKVDKWGESAKGRSLHSIACVIYVK